MNLKAENKVEKIKKIDEKMSWNLKENLKKTELVKKIEKLNKII